MFPTGAELDEVFAEAARSGLHTPERLAWMRQHGIRPATKRWEPREPVKQRSAWLAFVLSSTLAFLRRRRRGFLSGT